MRPITLSLVLLSALHGCGAFSTPEQAPPIESSPSTATPAPPGATTAEAAPATTTTVPAPPVAVEAPPAPPPLPAWPSVQELLTAVYGPPGRSLPTDPGQKVPANPTLKGTTLAHRPTGDSIDLAFGVLIGPPECPKEYAKECETECKGKTPQAACMDKCTKSTDYFHGCYDWWEVKGVREATSGVVHIGVHILSSDSAIDRYVKWDGKSAAATELPDGFQDGIPCAKVVKATKLDLATAKKIIGCHKD